MDLSKKIDLLQNKLGPDFVALAHALKDIDSESPDGQELTSIMAVSMNPVSDSSEVSAAS